MQTKMTIRLIYDFRGETKQLDTEIQLPLYIENIEQFLHSLPTKVAEKYGLDTFTYEFEMLESSPMEVISYESRIKSGLPELPMDVQDFLEAYKKVGPEAYLQTIADAYEVDLEANPRFIKAMKAAYNLGKEQRMPEKAMATSSWIKHCFT